MPSKPAPQRAAKGAGSKACSEVELTRYEAEANLSTARAKLLEHQADVKTRPQLFVYDRGGWVQIFMLRKLLMLRTTIQEMLIQGLNIAKSSRLPSTMRRPFAKAFIHHSLSQMHFEEKCRESRQLVEFSQKFAAHLRKDRPPTQRFCNSLCVE